MSDQVTVKPSPSVQAAATAGNGGAPGPEKVSPERQTRIQELEEQLRALRERRTQLLHGLN